MIAISQAALLLFTTASLTFAAGQRIVVVTSARDNNTPMMKMLSPPPLFTTGTAQSHGSYISAEPPCRSRRLEPFRQHVREECRLDAATHCPTAESARSSSRTMLTTPTYTNDVWLNSLMESVLESPSSSSSYTSEDSIGDIMNSMLNEFFEQMHVMYQALDGTDNPILNSPPELVPPPVEPSDVVEAHDVKEEEASLATRSTQDTSASSSSDVSAATPLDEVAENSLDVLVATLAQQFVDSEDENNSAETVDTTLSSSSQRMESFSTRLSQLGNDLLSETRRARRRRLQEANSSGEDAVALDHQMRVKERLARRLTEYRTDLVYHPGGMVTVYTSSFQPHSTSSSSVFPHAIRALPSETIVSPLGMGSTHVDECIKSRYENGDLSGSCFKAVDGFFAAVNDRSLSPPSHGTRNSSNSDDDSEPWYQQQIHVLPLLFLLIFGFFVEICVRPCFFVDKDPDDDDENKVGDSFDYEMLPEQEQTNSTNNECRTHQEERKEKVPRVYLGVPVQVV